LQRQHDSDTGSLEKVPKIGIRYRACEAVKGDALIDAFGNCILLDRVELGVGQPLTRCEVALKE
jgi:hypothetical protein